MIDPSVKAALEELRSSEQLHSDLGKFLLEIIHYPMDYLAAGVLNRSLALISGFCTLIENENFVAAAALVRLQLDTCLRFAAAWLTKDPHQFALQVLAGAEVRRIKDRDGRPMTDAYLVQKLTPEYPWVATVYKHTSG